MSGNSSSSVSGYGWSQVTSPRRVGSGGVNGGTGTGGRRASVPARVEASIRRDPIEPGPYGGPFREVAQAAPRREQRLLQDILGILYGAEHAIAVHVQFAAMRCDEITESVLVAGSGASESGVRHPHIVASTAAERSPEDHRRPTERFDDRSFDVPVRAGRFHRVAPRRHGLR